MMHQLSIIVTNAMNKFYLKDYIAATIFEGIKFCAARLLALVRSSGSRVGRSPLITDNTHRNGDVVLFFFGDSES